jgi:glycosyltransferase involved in cell wall biosynthesis
MTTKIIAVSDVVKESLIRHGIRGEKIDLLYNSIDISKFEKDGDPMYIQKEFGLPENSFVFIFIGRLIHQKAVDVLIDAFKKVNDSYLIIAGQGRDHDLLKEQVRELGLGSRIIFAGVRNDIPELLLASDCFVLPSRYEGLPLVLTEACAAGKPIVVSDFDAAKEVIVSEENGLVVPREDSEALAAAMNRIIQDESLRTKLSSAAKKTSEQFSISNHVRAILRYANLAS